MAIPRRRPTFCTGTSTHRSLRVEKQSSGRSPRSQEIPEWCRNYQLRIEAAREQLKQIKEAGEPEEAQLGLGEVEMRLDDPVQKQLQGLTQQMVHIIEACNSEKEIIEEEFLLVHQEIQILEGRIRTERSLIEGEVSGVGGQLMMHQAILQELRNGINILQEQDNDIVKEATKAFNGKSVQIQDLVKKTTTNHNSLLNHKAEIVKLQDDFKIWKTTQQSIENRVEVIDKYVKSLPNKKDLDDHSRAMDDTLQKIQEISTGLTMHMEQYKLSESSEHRPRSVVAGPSGTQQTTAFTRFADEEEYDSSSIDTREDASQFYARLRGGDGSDQSNQDAVITGETGPPGPNPPVPPGPEGNRRKKRKADVKPIKLKDPKPFEGNAGDDFETWWVLLETFIHDQPEKFEDAGRTINYVGGLMTKYAGAWHVQWERNALAGKHPRSWTTYQNDIKLRFEHKEARDVAYAKMEKIRYKGCIRDMFTRIQTFNDRAQLTGAALKKLILERLPLKILEQMHTVDLTGKTDQEMIDIITNAGKTAEKWEEAKENLLIKSYDSKERKNLKRKDKKEGYRISKKYKKPWEDKHTKPRKHKFKKDRKEKNTSSYKEKIEGISDKELVRRRREKECMRCAWPSDRKGNHKPTDCYRPIKLSEGTADFPKAKAYQKMKIGAVELESGEEDLYKVYSECEEVRDSASDKGSESEELRDTASENSSSNSE